MKKMFSFLAVGIFILNLSGCSSKAQAGEKETVIPVKVMEAAEENYPILLEYLGATNSEDVIKYSFKVPGKIASVNVKEGDYVKQGQVLAMLDNEDYKLAVEGARGQMEAAKGKVAMAKAQYDKALNGAQKEDINSAKLAVENAENNYNYAKESCARVANLYEQGIVSKQQLDDINIKVDGAEIALNNAKEVLSKAENGARDEDTESAKAQYEAAQAQYEAAQAQHKAKGNMLEGTSLNSGVSGYVVKVLNKNGEITAAGYPVVVVRTDDEVIDIQLAQKDVNKIKRGTKALVKLNEIKVDGVVSEIEQIPDPKSRNYKAKIKMNEKIPPEKFYIGSVAKVSINLEDKKGIWLPVITILNDGEDYVYVVDKEQRISRKNITIESIYEDKVLIKGLSLGDKVVIEGLKNVKPGYKVNVVQ
ncbi:efflux RND transporter periplasmic adaptor subunit [Clostridium aestuarii]|uniref:Efflux RND transporter periplasmic adaptor subunit n=1 Tax=Clostridium aestuarii TaxID=338193 RepID=A0ABT4D0A5_9CLOT|nr:efflux RND transporter periplasmic adaptor subunit [Clostridium aestuarii]MCY6484527.1 efflux RND transporter periplasmic adaptor subunit [Clostridium aestuarii]